VIGKGREILPSRTCFKILIRLNIPDGQSFVLYIPPRKYIGFYLAVNNDLPAIISLLLPRDQIDCQGERLTCFGGVVIDPQFIYPFFQSIGRQVEMIFLALDNNCLGWVAVQTNWTKYNLISIVYQFKHQTLVGCEITQKIGKRESDGDRPPSLDNVWLGVSNRLQHQQLITIQVNYPPLKWWASGFSVPACP
jgi:hypothetical protein